MNSAWPVASAAVLTQKKPWPLIARSVGDEVANSAPCWAMLACDEAITPVASPCAPPFAEPSIVSNSLCEVL